MPELYADLVIINGNVWTLAEPARSEAIAVFLDRIVKVGTNEEVKKLIGEKTEVIDAKGHTVIPGFIDSHTHLPWVGLNKIFLDLGETKSIEEVLELIKEETKKKKKGEWIIGRNWDQANWKEQRYITAKDLDPITPEHPVYLRHVSGHLATVNTLGFKRLNLPKDMKGVDKDENGNIIGTLRDIDLSDVKELRPTIQQYIKGLELAMEEALKLGITSIHDNITFESLPAYKYLFENHALKIRVYGIIYEDMVAESIKIGLKRTFNDKWFKIGAVKLMTDGAISSRTAYLFDDYADKKGEKGFALYDEKRLVEMIKKVHEAGLQIAAHAIGDKAIYNLINAITKTIPKDECKKALHRVEHAELIRKEDVEKAAEWGLVMSMQPNFVYRWGRIGVSSMYEQRLGTERTMVNNPFKWILNKKMLICFGSDCMPMGPLYGIKGALFHPNKELRLTLEESIRCYCQYPAIVSGDGEEKGTIEEGKLADVVILNKNLDRIDVEKEFDEVKVDYTIVGGKIAYKREK